jgi:YVTN family beta-propeller protein
LDLSVDGKTLYVANSGGNDVSVVDLTLRREMRRITIPQGSTFNHERPVSIVVAGNGTALLTTTISGSGWADGIRQIDLATGAVRIRTDLGQLQVGAGQVTRFAANADRSRIAIAARTGAYLYNATTDTFVRQTNPVASGQFADLNDAATTILVGRYVLNGNLSLRWTLDGFGQGVAVDDAGTTGYRVRDTVVEVLDLARGTVTRSIPLPGSIPVRGAGLALSPDESTLFVLTDKGLAFVSTRLTLQSPYTVWSQPSSTPLDGIGTWLATANLPAASPGRLPPSYLYRHVFGFVNSTAQGEVSLIADAGGRFAAFAVTEADGRRHAAIVPFDWAAGRFYYPFVYQVSPGAWGAWVYDHTAGAWAPVGLLNLPTQWGKLSPVSTTAVLWYGPPAETCSAFPAADVLYYPPTGYVGAMPVAGQATAAATGTGPGDCPAQVSVEAEVWARYRSGG